MQAKMTSTIPSHRLKITTTREQYACLLHLLQEAPNMVNIQKRSLGETPCTKEDMLKFWENVAKELNNLGPPVKDVTAWKKVWLDWKSYVKRKLKDKIEHQSSGDGSRRHHYFTEMEEGVIKLADLENSITKPKHVVWLPHSTPELNSADTDIDSDISLSSQEASVSQTKRSSSPLQPRLQKTLKQKIRSTENWTKFADTTSDNTLQLVEKFHKENSEKMESIASEIRRLENTTKILCDIKEAKLTETRRHNSVMEELMAKKVEIKQKMLEIELKKIEKKKEK